MTQRVLHVVSAMNRGGAETLLMNVYRNMDREKINFDFVSHRAERCDYDDEIEALGGCIYRVQSLGRLGPFHYVNELKKVMSQTSYAAVHSHTDYQSGFAALAGKLAGIKRRICHSHSNNWGKGNGFKQKMTLAAMQAIIRYAATDYCACSTEAARFLFGHSLSDQGKVQMIRNGVEINRFAQFEPNVRYSVKHELGIPPESKIIGHIGTFSPSKNHVFLLKLVKRMLEEGKDITAVLVGEGDLKNNMEKQAQEMGIYNHVRFLGVRTDIPRLMKAFDVFVFPSIFEGFGIVALEAQCSGTPCVASDSVPRLADMGVGLMSFISLNESLEVWSEQVYSSISKERPAQQTVFNSITSKGFNIKDSIYQWLDMYGVS